MNDEDRIRAYMAAKMAHIKMYNECMNLADGLDVEKFAELVRQDEREACAKLVEQYTGAWNDEGYALAQAIRVRGEKPPVKTYCGGKPNYCTPEETPEVPCKTHPDAQHGFDRNASHSADRYVCECEGWEPADAVNMSQDRVDETAKREHEPVGYINGMHGGYMVFTPINPSAVYLNGTALYLAPPKKEWVGLDGEIPGLGLVTEEFYCGMLFAEDYLREKNGG